MICSVCEGPIKDREPALSEVTGFVYRRGVVCRQPTGRKAHRICVQLLMRGVGVHQQRLFDQDGGVS